MDMSQIMVLCASMEDSHECFPFGPLPVCYKSGPKDRIFAQIYPDKITLRCTQLMGEVWKSEHPESLSRGYHCPARQAPYFIAAALDLTSDALICEMLSHAHQCILFGLK